MVVTRADGLREAKPTSLLDVSLEVNFLPYEKYCSVEYKKPSEEPEVRGYSAAKMSFNCLQTAVPHFQCVEQIPDCNSDLKWQLKAITAIMKQANCKISG